MTVEPAHRRPRISREYLEEHRRRRYVDAVAELLHEFPRHELSVSSIVRLAGTARNSFYEVFRGADDCIAYGAQLAAAELFTALEEEDDADRDWPTQLRDAVFGFYAAVAAAPLLAELFLIHATAGGVKDAPPGSATRVGPFEDLLRRGRSEGNARQDPPLPASADEYFARTIVAYATRRVRGPNVAALPAEAGEVTALVVGFYLGSEAADQILDDQAERMIAC